VNHLEKFMEKATRGARQDYLATVKGDVHDIGKNLWRSSFRTTGTRMINLGIKVLRRLDSGIQKHQPDAIGLPAAGEERAADGGDGRRFEVGWSAGADSGGGAALSENIRATRLRRAMGAGVLAKDAMTGLRLMNLLMDPAEREAICGHIPAAARRRWRSRRWKLRADDAHPQRQGADDLPIPPAPYLDRRVRDVPQLAEVWSYIQSVHAVWPALDTKAISKKTCWRTTKKRWNCSGHGALKEQAAEIHGR